MKEITVDQLLLAYGAIKGDLEGDGSLPENSDHAGILELIDRMPDHLKLPILMQYFGTDDMEEIKTELL